MRSFDLGGASAAGRRWAARCNCGALATTGAWAEALGFVTHHLRVTARPSAEGTTGHATPDLRGVDYWPPPLVVPPNVDGLTGREATLPRRFVRLVNSVARVVLGLPFFATRG